MSWFKTQYHGKTVSHFLYPSYRTTHDANRAIQQLKTYLADGGKIYIEYDKGARKGTIARLNITAEEVDSLYKFPTGMLDKAYLQKLEWELVFDDRPNVIKVSISNYNPKWPGKVNLEAEGTVWAYETKERPKEAPAILYDHFKVQLEVGQMVMYLEGRGTNLSTRFGYIREITPKGSIRVESIKTRAGHTVATDLLSPIVNSSDLIVLDKNNLFDKVTMAKLAI